MVPGNAAPNDVSAFRDGMITSTAVKKVVNASIAVTLATQVHSDSRLDENEAGDSLARPAKVIICLVCRSQLVGSKDGSMYLPVLSTKSKKKGG